MKKRLLQIFLLCLPLVVLFAVLTAGAAGNDIVASGDCGADGSDVKWSLDTKGNLAITGTGVMRDYEDYRYFSYDIPYTTAPWGKNRNDIMALTVSEGITVISQNAFTGLTRLTTVTLPDSIVRIKGYAFENCISLMKITFPDSVAVIEDGVFRNCSNLISFIIPENVTAIGANSFRDCKRLTKIVIPKSVEIIGVDAFCECDKLQNAQILGNVSIIKTGTFLNCPILEEVTIPGSVEIIEEKAFSGCAALKDVFFTGTESKWNNIIVDAGNDPLSGAEIHYNPSMPDIVPPTPTPTQAPAASDSSGFVDVSPNAYYAIAVEWAVVQGVTKGVSETNFAPADTCTRGQVVTFLWRAKDCPEPATTQNPFTDVDPSSAFYKAILWAAENGITSGTSETTFSPGSPCTRAHVVTFLWRSQGKPAATGAAPLADSFPLGYYTDAVRWADAAGLLDGTGEAFTPSALCPRADIVTYLYRNLA